MNEEVIFDRSFRQLRFGEEKSRIENFFTAKNA